MLDAFQADDQVCKLLHAARFTVDDQHFEAGIMVQMRVARRDNQVVMFVLGFGQLLGDPESMVVVDESDGADDGRIG